MTLLATRIKAKKYLVKLLLLATVLGIATACSEQRESVQIHFQSTWGQNPINCSSPHTALSDLRFYVSDVVLLDTSGAEHPLSMSEDTQWQQSNIALIDLENGEGSCSNGTSQLNSTVRGTSDKAEFAGLRFTIGVPFDLNHANPLLAKPPLDGNAMHWHWRSGYKFLRAGVIRERVISESVVSETDGFWLHLGSTACEGRVQEITACQNPNRVLVEIDDFSPLTDSIAVDLSAMFAGNDFSDGVVDNCSSSPAEATCMQPFDSLGLPFRENTNSAQTVFKVAH